MAKWYFRVERVKGANGGHEHLGIDILASNMNGTCSRTEIVTFKWQTHYENGHGLHDWYAFHIKLTDCRNLEALQKATRLANRILKDEEGRQWHEWSPQEVLDRLAKIKARRVVYDCRVSNFVPVEEVAPSNLKCWMDDYRALRANSCMVSALAETEEQAKEFIMVALFTEGYEEALANYIQAGKPVILRDDHSPEIISLDDLLCVTNTK